MMLMVPIDLVLVPVHRHHNSLLASSTDLIQHAGSCGLKERLYTILRRARKVFRHGVRPCMRS